MFIINFKIILLKIVINDNTSSICKIIINVINKFNVFEIFNIGSINNF